MTVKHVVVCEVCGFEAKAAHNPRDPLMKSGLGYAFNAIPDGWLTVLQMSDELTRETAELIDSPATLCSWQCLGLYADRLASRLGSWPKGQTLLEDR